LSAVLALALLAAPFASFAAGAIGKSAGAEDAHAAHLAQDNHSGHTPDDGGKAPSGQCEKHDSCNGSCCASCAQCSVTVPMVAAGISIFHPAYAPSGAYAFRSFLGSFLDRPPQAG
jgi:hypothetical protein